MAVRVRSRKAARLADGALGSFRKAHADLVKANELLGAEIKRHQAAVVGHRQAAQSHNDAQWANQRVINKLADFLG